MAEGRSPKTALLLLTENQSIMTKERIEELIAKDRLSQSEKQEIEAAVEESGVNVKINKGCRACYDKALAAMYEALQPKKEVEEPKPAAVSRDGYKFKRPRMSFKHGKTLYGENTLSNLEVGKLHPIIRNTYFVKAEQDGEKG
jgi:hypothetical protein